MAVEPLPGLPSGWQTIHNKPNDKEARWHPAPDHEYHIESRGQSWAIHYFPPGARTGTRIPRVKGTSPHGFHAADEAAAHWETVKAERSDNPVDTLKKSLMPPA